jgi:TolB-like protein/Tfp pilus assembly protein PilF
MAKLFGELKRRNVFRVAGVYAVVGWVLAQIATTLEESLGLPGWFDSVIVAVLLLGLPIALVLAWAFELTPEGVVRTESVPHDESITAKTGRKLDYAIVVGLVLLGALLAWQQLGRTPATSGEGGEGADKGISAASVAVLPFTDLSPGGDQEYFSDGISEEILDVLAGVDGLEVVSRTSSFQFKGRELGIPEIASSLKVRNVVEGSVRKAGDTIRVTAQLIDSATDKHLWSHTYERPLTAETVFAIQDEIAESIVAALSDTLGLGAVEPIEHAPTTRNLSAYELYLRARPLFLARVDLDKADAYLAEALEQDPEYAKAWEMRASLQLLTLEYGYSDENIDTAEARAKEFARRALAIEPRSATALAMIANADGRAAQELRRKTPLVDLFAGYDKALEIEPRNTEALNWRGLEYTLVGNLDAALRDFEACIGYEPYYEACVENYFEILADMGRDEEAMAAYIKALDNSSAKMEWAPLALLARTGDELTFKTTTNSPQLLRGWRRHDELWEAYRHPDRDHSELIESIRDFLDARPGNSDMIFRWIVDPIGTDWRVPEQLFLWDASMARYRRTETFKAYVRESGVYDYWQTAGYPPQCRPIGKDDFECN